MPFVPGRYVAKGVKIAAKATHAVKGAKVAKAVTKGYKTLRAFRNANPNKVRPCMAPRCGAAHDQAHGRKRQVRC